MTCTRNLFFIFIVCLIFARFSETATRIKRELKFPKGASFVVAVALASFLPKGLTDGLAHVLEFDLGFPFPENLAIGGGEGKKKWTQASWKPKPGWGNQLYPKRRTKRMFENDRQLSKDLNRVFNKFSKFLSKLGLDGEGCILRLKCEVRQISSSNCLLEELFIAFFGKSESNEEECENYIKTCPVSLFTIASSSEKI